MSKEITLALGGGGVKGIAHIGVLKILEEQGYKIRAIAGSSAGALIGAVYANGLPPEEIEILLTSINQKKMFGRKPSDGPSLMGLAGLTELLTRTLGNRQISDTLIPLAITTVDCHSGKQVILKQGKLVDAVLASAAVPGIFPPVEVGTYQFIDGAIVDPVPVQAARTLDPDLPVVASVLSNPEAFTDQTNQLPIPVPAPEPILETFNKLRLAKAFHIFVRAVEISSNQLTELKLKVDRPEVIIRPDVREFGLLDEVNVAQLVERGAAATIAALPDIEDATNWSRRIQRKLKVTLESLTPS